LPVCFRFAEARPSAAAHGAGALPFRSFQYSTLSRAAKRRSAAFVQSAKMRRLFLCVSLVPVSRRFVLQYRHIEPDLHTQEVRHDPLFDQQPQRLPV
jgi:hypothetical protein